MVISEQAVIQACNTDRGSGGVARWLTRNSKRVIAEAEATAPVGNPLDNEHRPEHLVGTYKASFVLSKKIGNQHVIRRVVVNTAPYATYVESGRRASREWQWFSSVAYPSPSWHKYTGAREGLHILGNALSIAIKGRVGKKKVKAYLRPAEVVVD